MPRDDEQDGSAAVKATDAARGGVPWSSRAKNCWLFYAAAWVAQRKPRRCCSAFHSERWNARQTCATPARCGGGSVGFWQARSSTTSAVPSEGANWRLLGTDRY